MLDFTRLRFLALHEFHVDRGRDRLAAVLFCAPALARPVATVHYLQGAAAADPLRVAGDDAGGVAVPLQVGQQLLDRDRTKLARPLRGRRRFGDHGRDREFDGDRGFLVEPVLQPVVDVPGGGLALHPAGEFGLSAADRDGAL